MGCNAWRVLAGGALVVALAGCSSGSSKPGSSGSDSSGTSTTGASAALLGPTKRATGEALKVGYVYAGQTQAIDARPELAIARATVKYVNEHLGGVAGRPLELVACADNLTPSGATDCANQMLAAKVPVVLSAEPSQPAPIMKLLEPAKVPFFIWSGVDQSIFLSPDGYAMGNPLILLAAPVKLAQGDGTKKVAMVYIDVPAAGALTTLATPLYKKAGLEFVSTAVPIGTPDMTPQIQAALSKGAQKFLVVGDPSFCISALKALKTLAFDGQVVINSACFGPEVVKGVPGGVDGVVIGTIDATDPKDPEVALYHAVAAKYAPGTPTNGPNAGGFAVVLGLARGLQALAPGAVTSEGIANALTAMPAQPMPLLSGQTLQCNRKAAAPLLPAVCSNGAALVTLDAAGKVKKSESFDAKPYITTG